MTTLLLQDIRKKDTKDAYKQEIIDCSYDVIDEFIEWNNLPSIDKSNINQVCDFMLSNVFNVEYNYENNRKRYPNLQYRITEWCKDRMTFGYQTYTICEWLVKNNLVHKDFIPANKDLTINMQLAAERHFEYIARTLMNNASSDVLSKLY
ncbi:hypothetical protein [Vibrio phage vB_VhaM_VH-8]|nr:hypothetical protein [Vibrio phage vB_VhaM_VH-8]